MRQGPMPRGDLTNLTTIITCNDHLQHAMTQLPKLLGTTQIAPATLPEHRLEMHYNTHMKHPGRPGPQIDIEISCPINMTSVGYCKVISLEPECARSTLRDISVNIRSPKLLAHNLQVSGTLWTAYKVILISQVVKGS